MEDFAKKKKLIKDNHNKCSEKATMNPCKF